MRHNRQTQPGLEFHVRVLDESGGRAPDRDHHWGGAAQCDAQLLYLRRDQDQSGTNASRLRRASGGF